MNVIEKFSTEVRLLLQKQSFTDSELLVAATQLRIIAAKLDEAAETSSRAPKKKQQRAPLLRPLAANRSMQAITVSAFSQVKSDGELYYVDFCGHFAFKLAGFLIHGAIGEIGRDLTKTARCKFSPNCNKGSACTYYHDPFVDPHSRDKRNFLPQSRLYCESNRPTTRHFGSCSSVERDLARVSREEVDNLHDEVAHDILCYFLLRTAKWT